MARKMNWLVNAFVLFRSVCRQTVALRGAGRRYAVRRRLVARNGSGDGRVQAEAQGHPDALPVGHQPDVRVVSNDPTGGIVNNKQQQTTTITEETNNPTTMNTSNQKKKG